MVKELDKVKAKLIDIAYEIAENQGGDLVAFFVDFNPANTIQWCITVEIKYYGDLRETITKEI